MEKLTDSVTVLMPVYNAEWCIKPAVDSVLLQTYSDFELLIINDGSTDNTLKILQSYNDSRIKIIDFTENKGLVSALNFGLDTIQSTYIIRMDADEICEPNRFEKQVAFMQAHPEIGVSATWYKVMGGGVVKTALHHEGIKYQMLNKSPHPHSGVIMRNSIIVEHALRYDKAFEYAEDLDFWMRFIKHTQFANIPEVLLHVTLNKGQLSKNLVLSSAHNYTLRKQYIQYLFSFLTDDESGFLSRCFNRILPKPISQSEFQNMLLLCDGIVQKIKSQELKIQLNSAVWFQLANNAPRSLKWLSLIKRYNWIDITLPQKIWLLVKPFAKIIKP